ncbi:hypothetical protein MYSTI_02161 [Myxococcus stipitatus DSM 14675]|uniref:HEAT repeat-containing PBS lyase n=1 Tax=Myxococcus stipitatus (strain DSM 14675 / JCM 12634 / Mx s8) TaxID=1278073 RepID=L7U5W2_MYXSD|nr:HEAT repeat domain-containing protein [Myxococcus stipitatus]AGC43488.1 hypothetical protein MYSTI_02161 [Myxococcus stipitatus DSM 14675]
MSPHHPVELTSRNLRTLLTQRLRTERLAPEELRALLAASEPGEVHAALLHLKQRMERLEGGDTPEVLLEALPKALGACTPETQVLLAELARLIPPALPLTSLVSLTNGGGPLSVEAEVAWLITDLLREPAKLTALPMGGRLLRAVQRLSPAEASDAEALVDALCAHGAPEIQLEGLRHLGHALELGLVTLTQALELSVRAMDATDERVALRALELLAEPWATRSEHVAALRSPPLPAGRSERLVLASLRVLARRGDAGALRRVLEDPRHSNPVRREALALMAPFAGPSELSLALHLCREDPLFFGPTGAEVLQTLYRRGVRCEPDDVPGVCELFVSSPTVSPALIAEVLSPRQREYVDSLETLSVSSPEFSRHLSLLREMDGPEALGLLRSLLVRPEAQSVRPELIEALGHQGREVVEEDLLGCFDAEPWACLAALRHVGGERTAEFLRTHPGLPSAEWRAEALALSAVLEETSAPVPEGGGMGQEVLASLQPVYDDAAFAEVSRLALQTQHPLRLQAIGQLGRESRRRTLRPLGQLLLDADEQVRAAAQQAIVQVGRGLHASGRMRPIPTRESADGAGARLVTECLLEQLQQRDLSDAQLERVLSQLVGRTHPLLARRLRRFLRHGSVQVQKLTLECLAQSGDARTVAWLVPFARAEDIYRLRQALSGLGEFKVEWAVPVLAEGLAHPNMNIKKTAAEALVKAGPGWPPPIGVMLDWVRRHDNPGLRESLVRALRATCARGYVATLLDALPRASKPREQTLLCEALSGVLSPRTLVALLRRDAPSATVLKDAVLGGVLELSLEARAELEMLLRRHGLSDRMPSTSEDPEQARLLRERRLDEDLAWMDDVLSTQDMGVLEAEAEDLTRLLSGLGSSGLTEARAAVLRRHLDRLRPLLDSTHSASRRLALALLRTLSGRLSETERVGVLAELRRAWAEGRLEPHQVLTALYEQRAEPSLEEARMASALPEESLAQWGAERLVLAEELSGPRLLEALTQARSYAVQRFFVPHALREVPPLQVLAVALREQNANLLEEVRRAWDSRVPEDVLLAALAPAVETGTPSQVETLTRWMADLGTEAARASLRRLARHTERGIALAALTALETPVSGEDEALLVDLLTHDPIDVRRQAARQLSRVRGLPRLQSLFDTLGEARPLRWVPPSAMDRRELETLRARLAAVEAGVEGEVWLDSLMELLEGLRPKPSLFPTQVLLLLDVWRLGRGRTEKRAAAVLRSYPPTRVLPFVLPMLREGHTAALQVLSGDLALGPELMTLFLRARGLDRKHFLEWLQRGASAQGRDSRTLEDALLNIVDEDEAHRALASKVLGGLASWGNRDDAFRLGERLLALANRKEGAWAIGVMEQGLERQGPEVRIALLSRVTSPTLRAEVVDMLAPLLLEDPSLEKSLTVEVMRDVERKLESLAWEVPEPELAAMKWMVVRKKPRVAERLTEHLTHRKSSIRIQAHRLLKNLVPRETYLELTCVLLGDTEAGHVVRAIRTLSFGGHLPAVAQIAALLHDRRNAVARAAREALLVMGDAALPILRGELARARPDRRERLTQVISSLAPTTHA